MNHWPASPTLDELHKGILVLPKVADDPYGTHGVWSDGTTVYYIDGTSIFLAMYDRELDTDPPTGVGWKAVELT